MPRKKKEKKKSLTDRFWAFIDWLAEKLVGAAK